MQQGYFVTGTDTAVGKTLVSQVLIHHLRRTSARVAGFKPVASGCEITAEGLRNDDALALQRASSVVLPYDQVNPYAFAPPIAPHLAAEEVGVRIDLDRIKGCIAASGADSVVVEGVGGWRVPLNDSASVADLAALLGLPVVLVVGLRLGCINHALLTLESIQHRGLPVAGWVANQIVPTVDRVDEIVAALSAELPAPLLLKLPWFPRLPSAAAVAAEFSFAPPTR